MFLDIKPISYGSYFLEKYFFIFETFSFFAIKQNPTPQLKVFNISLSDKFLLFSHLKMFIILILERSMSTERFSGTDLNKFSIRPPPVICALSLLNLC